MSFQKGNTGRQASEPSADNKKGLPITDSPPLFFAMKCHCGQCLSESKTAHFIDQSPIKLHHSPVGKRPRYKTELLFYDNFYDVFLIKVLLYRNALNLH
ncbi:hypothetical protein [Prevotella corporis]|uniref:hypothetical protein n=1 Tax=Prevotella corporis TaxID=28128 RepID=UPI000404E9B4|nr:hypothetical protein [Prevotella corporis]